MKAQERYELMMKSMSEGKSQSEAAREQNVTPGRLSQIKKKFSISPAPQSVSPESTASEPYAVAIP